MNEIQSVSPTDSGFSQATGGILGKDDFLRILVTQLRHQDPINPVKGEEFAAQLAQFSSVEQLHNINASLATSLELDLALSNALNNTMATTFIGKEVKAVGDSVSLKEGKSATLHYQLAGATKQSLIEVRDVSGAIVRTIEVSGQAQGSHEFEWNGKNNAGDDLPEGSYTFNVNAVDADGNSVAATPLIVGTISSIRYENGAAILRIGDLEIDLGDVIEIGLGDQRGE